MVASENSVDWLNIITSILTVLSIFGSFIVIFRKKFSNTEIYKKYSPIIKIYYLFLIERKVKIGAIVCGFITLVLFIIIIYNYFNSMQNINTYSYHPADFIINGQAGFMDIVFGKNALLIDKGKVFAWRKGWSENTKLKRINLQYFTSGTKIEIYLGMEPPTSYLLNGSSNLMVENISLPYDKYPSYGMSIVNIGDGPLYILEIETQEELPKTVDSTEILIMSIFLLITIILYNKLQDRDNINKPIDLLYEEAKLADKIKNIQIELESYQSMLNLIEKLHLENELSPKFYLEKKGYCDENMRQLNEEKNKIESEIEDIFNEFKK